MQATGNSAENNTMEPDVARAELLERALVELAVESWRFSKLFLRVLEKLDAGDQARHASQLRYFKKKVDEQLEAAGLSLVSLEGQAFDPGMAAVAINVSDFASDERLLVEQMVEPIVMGPAGLRRQGTVVLRKAHQ